jgi:hypothetical protein
MESAKPLYHLRRAGAQALIQPLSLAKGSRGRATNKSSRAQTFHRPNLPLSRREPRLMCPGGGSRGVSVDFAPNAGPGRMTGDSHGR